MRDLDGGHPVKLEKYLSFAEIQPLSVITYTYLSYALQRMHLFLPD